MALDATVHFGNDTVAELTGLQNGITDAYLNAATVTVVFKDNVGTEVLSSQTLSYVAASNGDYRATIDQGDIASLVIGDRYFAEYTAAESGLDLFIRIPFIFSYRES